jgi:hypothetical protein
MRIESTYAPFKITSSLEATGSGQSDAASMPTDFCVVTSEPVGQTGCGVILPSDAEAGEIFFVGNAVNDMIWVYPPSGGSVWYNGSPVTDAGSNIPAFKSAMFICMGSGIFFRAQFGS